MIDFDSYIPYYIQLMDVLKEKIEKEGLKPGDQLLSETELCNLYRVSRTVVRQALRELELEGLITRRKGKGTFIARPKIEEGLVQKLTGFFQDMVDRGHIPETKVLVNQVMPAPLKVAKYLEIEPGAEVHYIERLRFVQGEPIVLVDTYIPYVLCPGLGVHDLSAQSLYALLEDEYGLTISRGKRFIEAVAANEREAQLLKVEIDSPMILLDSVTYLADGTPMEYYHAIHRGDRSRFEVELVRITESQSIREVVQKQEIPLPRSN